MFDTTTCKLRTSVLVSQFVRHAQLQQFRVFRSRRSKFSLSVPHRCLSRAVPHVVPLVLFTCSCSLCRASLVTVSARNCHSFEVASVLTLLLLFPSPSVSIPCRSFGVIRCRSLDCKLVLTGASNGSDRNCAWTLVRT